MENSIHKKIREYEKTWIERCYTEGIPDEAPNSIKDKVPNWKSIAMCILNNDLNLTKLGFEAPNSKYYSVLKRIEIDAREYEGKQIKLKL